MLAAVFATVTAFKVISPGKDKTAVNIEIIINILNQAYLRDITVWHHEFVLANSFSQ